MIIAIDGYSSCGKSTLAKDLANKLGMRFIDSGAMYRAITYYFIQNAIDIHSSPQVEDALSNTGIEFTQTGICLNGQDVSREIRLPAVADLVSPVATISSVRRKLVELQQSYGVEGNIIMDGRDIGSVVFPKADYKFFVTADVQVRAQRRYEELNLKGTPLPFSEVLDNLNERDQIDSSRADSPLIQTSDAIVIDTTNHTRESQLDEVLSYLKQQPQFNQ